MKRKDHIVVGKLYKLAMDVANFMVVVNTESINDIAYYPTQTTMFVVLKKHKHYCTALMPDGEIVNVWADKMRFIPAE